MPQNTIATGNYFLVGFGIGSLMGVLLAPKSGAETRKSIAKKTGEGNDLARMAARKMRARAEDTVERGKKIIAQTQGQIATIEAGIETYNREEAKAPI